jgi:hypothetical protein
LCRCWCGLNRFPEATHLIRIVCNYFVDDNECFDFVAHWDRTAWHGKRHRAIGRDYNLDTICVCVQHVRIQSEIDVWLVKVKFEERVDKRDEILLHTIIDFEVVFFDLGDKVLHHLDNIRAKSH